MKAPPADFGRAGCKRAEACGCDALADYWSERQISSAVDLEQGKADAAVLHRACDDLGVSSACMGLAFMYKYGTATGESDKATSNKYWARVAELDDLNGYRGKALSEEGERVLAATEKECEDGRARACAQLGWAAYSAVMQKHSPKNSYEGYRKACVLGSGTGCRWSGHLVRVYHLGTREQSQAYLRRGCEDLHSLAACTELGHFVEDVLKKPAEAKVLYEPACAAGNREACFSLALTLDLEGSSPKRVAELFTIACEAGEDDSCSGLAKHVGDGCALDLDLGGDADLGARAIGVVRAFCSKAEDVAGCANVKACK
jgi:TPR repeat protein